MKGNIKITVEIKDDMGHFPITETFTIARDNTYEGIESWITAFRKILFCAGFSEQVIDKYWVNDEV